MSVTGLTPTSQYGSTCFANHTNKASGRTSRPLLPSLRARFPSGPASQMPRYYNVFYSFMYIIQGDAPPYNTDQF